jgi:ceramide glucosyltransferase
MVARFGRWLSRPLRAGDLHGRSATNLILAAVAPLATVPPFLALWFRAEAWLCRVAGWPAGWRVMMLRDRALLLLWLTTFARRGFSWLGNAGALPRGAS